LLPSDVSHEARDRDYFFVLGFWVWGVWAGLGAFAFARRLRLPSAAGVALAALPIALNWSAVTRRGEPEASLPREVAAALLDSLPKNAVLFVSGDNDTYPLWFAQQVEHRRQDVTVVTLPLLAASWYADELARRRGLRASASDLVLDPHASVTMATARGLARAASAKRMPVAVALTVPATDRDQLMTSWTVSGVYMLADATYGASNGQSNNVSRVVAIDSQRVRAATHVIEEWRKGRVAKASTDPTNESFLNTLSCPALILDRRAKPPAAASLDSTCNLR
jgi:hypothetical protein